MQVTDGFLVIFVDVIYVVVIIGVAVKVAARPSVARNDEICLLC